MAKNVLERYTKYAAQQAALDLHRMAQRVRPYSTEPLRELEAVG